jgi:hypothetical protein
MENSMKIVAFLILITAVTYAQVPASRTSKSDAEKIASAMQVGPKFVTQNATVLDWPSSPGGETVRVFGRPEELAERLEASGYDIPASEIEAGMELHLPCLVKVGQGHNGYKNIEEFLPEAAE